MAMGRSRQAGEFIMGYNGHEGLGNL